MWKQIKKSIDLHQDVPVIIKACSGWSNIFFFIFMSSQKYRKIQLNITWSEKRSDNIIQTIKSSNKCSVLLFFFALGTIIFDPLFHNPIRIMLLYINMYWTDRLLVLSYNSIERQQVTCKSIIDNWTNSVPQMFTSIINMLQRASRLRLPFGG